MAYKLLETLEAIEDVTRTAEYLLKELKNKKATLNFLDQYNKEIKRLESFPFGYRGVGFEYRGYEIRLKPFDTYNVFFIVDMTNENIVILRVLKNKQNWQMLLQEYTKNQ